MGLNSPLHGKHQNEVGGTVHGTLLNGQSLVNRAPNNHGQLLWPARVCVDMHHGSEHMVNVCPGLQ